MRVLALAVICLVSQGESLDLPTPIEAAGKALNATAQVGVAAVNVTAEVADKVAERIKACNSVTYDAVVALLDPNIYKPEKNETEVLRKRFEKAMDQCVLGAKDKSWTYESKVYPFNLWPDELLARLAGGMINTAMDVVSNATEKIRSKRGAPYTYSYVDYRTKNWVSPVKNQGACGSCYAFAGTALVESQYLKNNLGNLSFSEQQIVDCTYKKYGGFQGGCSGGNSIYVLQYFNESVIAQTSSYPYVGKDNQQCKAPSGTPKKLDRAYVQLQSEDHLAFLLNQNGPIVVMVNASSAFQSYGSGVYNNAAGCAGSVNHFVTLVGLVKQDNTEQWILKNSWGDQWGEKGYIRFPKGQNMCQITTTGAIVGNLNKAIVSN